MERLDEGSKHEQWRNPTTDRRGFIPRRRGEIPVGTLRSILRQLGLTLDDLNQA